ncbi:retropepsin-like aspartic protease [Sphingomonas sp. S-NIH.Pt15_0812]|uniref:retropepsin-like aspartic protease family protein n=1 Tax=Sphingomonas sp. S-NIH.Pt15_0812 TaxID=1920129 RepID=UPI000F7DB802|nr:retropepsin-like aspartic protease [Sphingomonas sp. S-NIH.Pt15_0812]RSU48883.1 TIGR02281 family clan AA aspartic protease [Sphingomonas sp. S-NIH.Pt15_0812]
MSDRGADMLFYALLLILPLAGLIARRPPLAQMLKMALAWIGIFAVGLLAVSQRDRLPNLFSDQRVSGGETRIRQDADGHFYADAEIDGVKRRMLIDSGATTTALSVGTVKALGLSLNGSPFAALIQTANGRVAADTARVKALSVGSIRMRDLGVVVSPAFGDTDVLGMNFLSRLASWHVDGQTLVMTATDATRRTSAE